MATTVTQTIISAGGGDFTTIALWESGTDNNLVAADEVRVGEIRPKGSDWAENVTILGATTDATRFRRLNVRVVDHHTGTAATGERVKPTANGHVFTVSEDFFQAEWFEVSHGNPAESDEGFRVNNTGCFFRHMLIYDLDELFCDGIRAGANGITITVENCFFWDIDRTACHIQNQQNVVFKVYNCSALNVTLSGNDAYSVFGFDKDSARNNTNSTMEVRNCVADKAGGTYQRYSTSGHTGTFTLGENVSYSPSGATGVLKESNDTSVIAVNDIVGTPTTADTITGDSSSATGDIDVIEVTECYHEGPSGAQEGLYTANSDFNASSDASASAEFGATNTIDNFTPSDEFQNVSLGSEDLHLKATSQFIDAGEDLTTPISEVEDIDDESRAGLIWDMGADELIPPIPLVEDAWSPAWRTPQRVVSVW